MTSTTTSTRPSRLTSLRRFGRALVGLPLRLLYYAWREANYELDRFNSDDGGWW